MKNSKSFMPERDKILSEDSSFVSIESYKLARTNIMFSLPKTEGGKVISVTSSMPNEGKTTTTVNLAITFAQLGAKVALIDCDLRKPRVHRYLSLERGQGLSDILCGFTTAEKVILRNVRENLDVITAGEIPPNPAELLTSDSFDELVSELSKKYDYVFVDTPPVNVVADSVIVAKKISGVVLIARENMTTFDQLDDSVAALKKGNVTILGILMLGNQIKNKYYSNGKYYKNKKYDYKYGDSADSGKHK